MNPTLSSVPYSDPPPLSTDSALPAMPHSAAATVRLAPIIKTNHAQALALDMHMIQQLHHDPDDEQQQQQQQQLAEQSEQQGAAALKSFRPLNSGQSVHTAYSSPQLGHRSALSSTSPAMPRRTSADSNSQPGTLSASPSAGARSLQSQVGQHNTLLYTFPSPPPISEESAAPADSGRRAELESVESLTASPSAAPSTAPLPSSAPLHVATSSSAISDSLGMDALLSPGPLHPSSSCSHLSAVQSPHSALHSPSSLRSEHLLPAATSPLLSPATATADSATPTAAGAGEAGGAARSASHHSADVVKSLSFADKYPSGGGGDMSSDFSTPAPLLYPSTSSHASHASLSAPLVVPVTSTAVNAAMAGTGLTARKQCKISDSGPAGHSLLRHCLPCLPASSASSSSSTAATRSAAAYRRQSRQSRQSRRRRATGDDGCCSNLVTCNPFRLSFRFTLVLLCILQVVVSVGIVWYLGYSNSESLIGSLSSQLRETALVEITGQIHDQMVRPMRAVNQLQYSLRPQSARPERPHVRALPNVTGLYADLSFVIFNYPEISGAGCSTRNNVFVAAINISAYLAAGASPPPPTASPAASRTPSSCTTTARPVLPLPARAVAQHQPQPGPCPTTTPAAPWPTSAGLVQRQGLRAQRSGRSTWQPSMQAKGAFAWSGVYQLAQATNSTVSVQQNQSLIAASKAYMTPDGSVGYVCFASVFLSRDWATCCARSVCRTAPTDWRSSPTDTACRWRPATTALMMYTSKQAHLVALSSSPTSACRPSPLHWRQQRVLARQLHSAHQPHGRLPVRRSVLSERAGLRCRAHQLRRQRVPSAGHRAQQHRDWTGSSSSSPRTRTSTATSRTTNSSSVSSHTR